MDFGTELECKYAYETLVKCSEATIQGLSKEPKTLALALRVKGFISDEMVEEINDLPATNSQNARKLYTAILGTVKQHPHKYEDFVSILQGNTVLYGDLLKLLDKTDKEKGSSAQNQYSLPLSPIIWGKWRKEIIIIITLISVCVCMGVYWVYPHCSAQTVVHSFKLFHQSKTLPYLSKNFVGRDTEVSEILEIVNFTRTDTRIVNIVGSPGFGKSTIAKQIGHKLVDMGARVHYVDVGEFQKANIEHELTEKILESAGKSVKRISFDRLLRWARDIDENTLVILDNCDDVLQSQKVKFQSALDKLVKSSQFYVKVLITSREVVVYVDDFRHYTLHSLNLEASVKLLDLKVNPEVQFSQGEREQIANLTGHVPLALHVIGSLLNLHIDPPTPSTVIEELRKNPMVVLSLSEIPEQQQVNSSIGLSYKYLSEELKAVACYLALFPGSFTKDTAIAIRNEYQMEPNESLSQPSIDKLSLRTLLYMSLLEYNERTQRYQYHPLMRKFFLEQAKHRENRQYEGQRFDIGFRFHFARLLHTFTVDFKTKYVNSLRFLDTEKHNLQYLIDDLKRHHTLQRRSLVLAVDVVVEAIETDYLECRFEPRYLTESLLSILRYLDKHVQTFQKRGLSKPIITIDSTEWTTQEFYFRLYTRLTMCLGKLVALVKGEEKAVNLYEKRRQTIETLFAYTKSDQVSEYSPNINTHHLNGAKRIHRTFYVTLGEYYFALDQHSKVAECHSHVIEQIKQCTGVCTYYEIGLMYVAIANLKEAATFFERSLKHENLSPLDRTDLLYYLYKFYSHNWPWSIDEAKLTVQRLLEEYPKLTVLQEDILFERRESILLAIQTLISAGEQSTADSLEEKLLAVIESTKPDLQLSPDDALEMMDLIVQGRNHSKAIEWGTLMLRPFLNQSYTNFTQKEHKSLLQIRIHISYSKLYLRNILDGLEDMSQVAQFILAQDNKTTYAKEFQTACAVLTKYNYLHVCYGSGFSVTNLIPVGKVVLSTFKKLTYLVFWSVIDTFPNLDHSSKQMQPPYSTSKDIARGSSSAIQLAKGLLSDIRVEVEQTLSQWLTWVLYPLTLVFRNPLFRFTFNVITVWIRLWLVNIPVCLVMYAILFSYLYIIEKVFKLYHIYYSILLDPTKPLVLVYTMRTIVTITLLITKSMLSITELMCGVYRIYFVHSLKYFKYSTIPKIISIDMVIYVYSWFHLISFLYFYYISNQFPSVWYVYFHSYHSLYHDTLQVPLILV